MASKVAECFILIKGNMTQLVNDLAKAKDATVAGIKALMGSVGAIAQKGFGGVSDAMEDSTLTGVRKMSTVIQRSLNTSIDIAAKIIQKGLQGGFGKAVDATSFSIGKIGNVVKSTLFKAIDLTTQTVPKGIGKAFEKTIPVVKPHLARGMDVIKNTFEKTSNMISPGLTRAVKEIGSIFTKVAGVVAPILGNGLIAATGTAGKALKSGLGAAFSVVGGVARTGAMVLKTVFNTAVTVATQGTALALKGTLATAFTAAGAAGKAAGMLVGKVWNQTKQTIADMKNVIGQTNTAFKYAGLALGTIAATADTSGPRIVGMLAGSGKAAGYSKEQLDHMAGSIAETTGASRRLVKETQAILLSYGAIRGDVFKGAVGDISGLSAALGIEMPAAAHVLGAALQDPARGIELLKNLGQTITPVREHLMKMRAASSPQGWKDLQKHILAVSVAVSKVAQYDLERSLTGSFGTLKARFVDLGDAIAPSLVPLVDSLTAGVSALAGFAEKNKDLFVSMGQAMLKAFEPIGKIISYLTDMFGKLPPRVQEIIGTLVGVGVAAAVIGPIFTAIVGFVLPVIAIINSLTSIFGILIATVVLTGAAFTDAFNSEKWGPQMQANLDRITAAINPVLEVLGSWGDMITSRLEPTWEKFTGKVVEWFDKIAGFIADNQDVWEYWAQLVGEIIGGVIADATNTVISFVDGVGALFSWLSDLTGVTWGGIMDVITGVLDTVSLVASNFGLSFKIAWTAIQLGAVVAFDKIVNAWWTVVAALSGSWEVIKASFTVTIERIKTGWNIMVEAFKGSLTALGAAIKAIFSGKSPIEAFKKSLEGSMDKIREMREKDPDNRDYGKAAALAFNKGYDEVMAAHAPDANMDTRNRLSEQLAEQTGALRAGREAQRLKDKQNIEARKDGQVKADEAEKNKPYVAKGDAKDQKGDKVEVEMQGTPQGLPNMVMVKFETIGLRDMWMKIQEKLTGGGMLALADQTAKATKMMAGAMPGQTDALKKIEANTGKLAARAN